jgi:hypothetical protein
MGRGDTLLNAFIGAVVTVVTAPLLPVAAVVGGAVAGYLQAGDTGVGAKVGAISGLIAAVPAVLIVFAAALLLPFFQLELAAVGLVVGFFVFVVVVGYLVGAGALGGALGAYLYEEL